MKLRLTNVFFAAGLVAIAAVTTHCDAADAVTLGDDASLLGGIPGKGPLKPAEVNKWLGDEENHKPLTVTLPKGLDAAKQNIFIPEDNPMTRAKIELGRQLYFDTRLSSDNTISCASCHHPDKGYGFDTQFGVGVDGQEGGRNSPVSYNRIVSKAQFWDGRADSLEAQAVGPIANPIEMGNTHEKCVETLASIPSYKRQFQKIFKDGVNIDNVGKAIATFERAIVTQPAPYDYYQPITQFEKLFADDLDDLDDDLKERYDGLKQAADEHKMSESAQRGMALFAKKAKCAECHAGANFSDEQYHNLGVGMEAEKPDWGRFEITKEEKDKGAFKTPTLRNVALSPPYMHDGSQKTLEEVVEWYNKGGHKNEWLSDKMKPLELNDQEKKDLVAFMKEGLTSDFPAVETGRLPRAGKKPNAKKGNAKKGDAKKAADAKKPAAKEAETNKVAATEKKMKSDEPAETVVPAKSKVAKSKEKGFLGVTFNGQDLSKCEVKRIYEGGAAAKAGLQPGDVIVGINGKDTVSFEELKTAIGAMTVGEVAKIKVKRGDSVKELTAELQQPPKK